MNISEIDETEKPAVEKAPAANPSDLESLLAGYNEPAKVEPSPTPAATQQPIQPNTNNGHGPASWYGNPMYYQTGKKAGQLKPPKKAPFYQQPVNVSVNPNSSEISGDIISGALFLTIINLLFPMLFSVINNMVSKKKMAYEDLQIDEKTLKQLDSLSEKALKHIKIEANPVGILIFTMIGLYTLQFMTVKMLNDIEPKLKVSK